MKLLDTTTRVFILVQGTGTRWLKEELSALSVRIPLCDGCLEELFLEADQGAWSAAAGSGGTSYTQHLRQQLRMRATFIHRWTGTDEKIPDDQAAQALVRIARKYALPRPWKLSEPVVVEYRRSRPSYWTWASEMDAGPVAPA